jgi:hypothetical protein
MSRLSKCWTRKCRGHRIIRYGQTSAIGQKKRWPGNIGFCQRKHVWRNVNGIDGTKTLHESAADATRATADFQTGIFV